QVLQAEVNKIRRKLAEKKHTPAAEQPEPAPETPENEAGLIPESKQEPQHSFDAEEEKLLILLLKFGGLLITTEAEDEKNVAHELQITLGEYIIFELWRDNISFENPLYRTVLDEYIRHLREQRLPELKDFQHSPDPVISGFVFNNV